jgi:tetratricopeptide (TPR) repeat protein
MLGRVIRELSRRRRPATARPAAESSVTCQQWLADAVDHQNRGQLAEAELLYRRILAQEPGHLDAMHLLGHLLTFHGRPGEAADLLQQVVERDPDSAPAHYNFSQALLAAGDLARGWREYEWRFEQSVLSSVPSRRNFPFPAWQGEPLGGKTILVWGEQGVGDQIAFASLLPELAEQAGRCIYEGSAKLTPLFARSFPKVQVVPHTDPPHPATQHGIDYQVAAGSVARWLRPVLSSFPKRSAYLAADAQRAAYWRERLISEFGAGIKVGICWRGGNTSGTRSLHYTALGEWSPILAVPGVHFVNLQYDECKVELQRAHAESGVAVHEFPEVDMFDDLDETAALMKTLDLVISAPVAVSVQAAALGIPTWELCWGGSWQAHGTGHNLWNPMMRSFRRGRDQTWAEVIEQIACDLRRVALDAEPKQADGARDPQMPRDQGNRSACAIAR